MGCNSSTEASQIVTDPKTSSIPTDIPSTQIRPPSPQVSHQNSHFQSSDAPAVESKLSIAVSVKKTEELKPPDVAKQVTVDIVNEPEVVSVEQNPEPQPEPFIIHCPPGEEMESSDDGSELSRDNFEGYIVTNTPSPAIVRSEDGVSSIASSEKPQQQQQQQQQQIAEKKSFVPEKPVTVITSKEEFVYEYERWQPFVQWGQSKPGHILPSDPGLYSDVEGVKFGNNPEDVAPSHPKWWRVISSFEPVSKVEDPWEYSVDFRNYEWYPSKQKKTFVRRRKLRRLVGDSRHHQIALPQGITSFSSSAFLQNPAPPTVKGNIRKSGGKLQAFNDRYFVLESSSPSSAERGLGGGAHHGSHGGGGGGGSYLIYYLKYTDSPPYGNNERDRMNLKHCLLEISPEGHVILTSAKGKTYVLDLQDHPDQEKWIQALRSHISFANSQDNSNEMK